LEDDVHMSGMLSLALILGPCPQGQNCGPWPLALALALALGLKSLRYDTIERVQRGLESWVFSFI